MLELRRFQEEALEALRGYLDALTEQAEEQSRYNRFLKTQNRPPRHMAAPRRRALILERQRLFVPADVERDFVVMLLMLQASSRETKAREAIDGFNPRFILELSATPKPERSNLLVDISGAALKEEQMIKLPIRLKNVSTSDWQTTLGDACERLKELDAKAKRYRSEHGRYIRPILLARVERTGSDQRGRGLLHAEDVREYLTEQIGFRPDEVRVKGGGKNEIANTDLMSPFSPVRIVITKAALQEGWDCPFAYVLALLDRGTSSTALTQMIGRVLRQPYQDIYNNRMNTVRQMRHDIAAQKEQLAKRVFEDKLRAGEIIFDLNATQSGWKIPQDLRMKSIGKPRYLTRETNEPIERSLFDKYEERNFNQFERKVAGYLDEAQAIEWWHRVAARQEYGLRLAEAGIHRRQSQQ